jgi:signal transduction histidine kinase
MSFAGVTRLFSVLRGTAMLAALAGVYFLYGRFERLAAETEYALNLAARAAALSAAGDKAAHGFQEKKMALGAAIASQDPSFPAGRAAFNEIRAQYYAMLQTEEGWRTEAHGRSAVKRSERERASVIVSLALAAANRGLQERNLLLVWTALAYSSIFLLLFGIVMVQHYLLNTRFFSGLETLKVKLFRAAAPFYPQEEKRGEMEELALAADALDITLENSMLARIRLAKETSMRLAHMKLQTRALELTRRKVISLVEDLEEAKTELQREKAALKKTSEKLARSNKDLEQFAYVAAHDLKEPLRVVSSFSSLLAKRYANSLDGDARDFIGYIDQGAQRAEQLVSALFKYSKVTYTSKDFKRVDCGAAMRKAMFNLKISLEEKKAAVDLGELPVVIGDENQLIQLFQNLLSNALKFNVSAAPEIRVTAAETPGEWVLRFSDNGIGIPAEHFERIFMIFQRLHTADKYPGAGIGLALCKKIAENHGGKIWVESYPGGGSVFYVALPSEAGPQGPQPETHGAAGAKGNHEKNA